jgi:Fic family protein
VIIAAVRLQEQLPLATRQALAPLLAHMNCYYSNLIEGHKTYPDEVEAVSTLEKKAGQSSDPQTNLVHEAIAHIQAQHLLRERLMHEPTWNPVQPTALSWMHEVFYQHLPEAFRWTETQSGSQRVAIIPGQWRDRSVTIGSHIPPEVTQVPTFLERFAEAYSECVKINPMTIAKIAASHHRFAWIHPFVDGNGRVARLLTDALIERCGLGANGLWCVGRGFARQLKEYRATLSVADGPRVNDLDGRGPRTQAGLDRWCQFVVGIMHDQITFMFGLIQPTLLRDRIMAWAERESARKTLHPQAGRLIAEVVIHGSISRSEAVDILRLTDRYGREQIRILIELGYFSSQERAPLRPAFPLHVVPWWFPDLFPGDVEARLMRKDGER